MSVITCMCLDVLLPGICLHRYTIYNPQFVITFLIGQVESHYSRATQWLASKPERALICFLRVVRAFGSISERVPKAEYKHFHFSYRYSSSDYSNKILPTNKRKSCGLNGQTLGMFALIKNKANSVWAVFWYHETSRLRSGKNVKSNETI